MGSKLSTNQKPPVYYSSSKAFTNSSSCVQSICNLNLMPHPIILVYWPIWIETFSAVSCIQSIPPNPDVSLCLPPKQTKNFIRGTENCWRVVLFNCVKTHSLVKCWVNFELAVSSSSFQLLCDINNNCWWVWHSRNSNLEFGWISIIIVYISLSS